VNFSIARYVNQKPHYPHNEVFKIRALLIVLFLASSPNLVFADPIEGDWKRPNGVLVRFAVCGKSFCASPTTTKYAGLPAGKLSADGKGSYAGTLIDLQDNRSYSGKAQIHETTLILQGCIFGGLICKSENWVKQ